MGMPFFWTAVVPSVATAVAGQAQGSRRKRSVEAIALTSRPICRMRSSRRAARSLPSRSMTRASSCLTSSIRRSRCRSGAFEGAVIDATPSRCATLAASAGGRNPADLGAIPRKFLTSPSVAHQVPDRAQSMASRGEPDSRRSGALTRRRTSPTAPTHVCARNSSRCRRRLALCRIRGGRAAFPAPTTTARD